MTRAATAPVIDIDDARRARTASTATTNIGPQVAPFPLEELPPTQFLYTWYPYTFTPAWQMSAPLPLQAPPHHFDQEVSSLRAQLAALEAVVSSLVRRIEVGSERDAENAPTTLKNSGAHWCMEHHEELAALGDCYVAIVPSRGIIANSETQEDLFKAVSDAEQLSAPDLFMTHTSVFRRR